MTVGPTSQCATCTRLRSPFSRTDGDLSGGPFCEAFPGGIPDVVYENGVDHRQPVDGDRGIRWESNGDAFPDWALIVPS